MLWRGPPGHRVVNAGDRGTFSPTPRSACWPHGAAHAVGRGATCCAAYPMPHPRWTVPPDGPRHAASAQPVKHPPDPAQRDAPVRLHRFQAMPRHDVHCTETGASRASRSGRWQRRGRSYSAPHARPCSFTERHRPWTRAVRADPPIGAAVGSSSGTLATAQVGMMCMRPCVAKGGCLPPEVAGLGCLVWRSVRPALPACRAGVGLRSAGAPGWRGGDGLVGDGRACHRAGQPARRPAWATLGSARRWRHAICWLMQYSAGCRCSYVMWRQSRPLSARPGS